jgi:hypothetical protein
MPWVKLDDSIDQHRKIRRAGNEAAGVWMRSLCYSAGALTDGHVDPEWLVERTGSKASKVSELLVVSGLWEPNDDGWGIHDYLDFNPSRASVLAKRESDAARKAKKV